MKGTRAQGRSGIFKKRQAAVSQKPARTPDEIKAVLEKIAESWKPAVASASAFDLINQIEAQALEV